MKKQIYQMKISLKGSKPLVWRRFLVKSHITFQLLHETIQEIMGWTHTHLYEFNFGKIIITDAESIQESSNSENEIDSAKTKLEDLISEEKEKISYTYDFGDDWGHEIIVEKILPDNSDLKNPVCLAGKNACPPEDCGGIYGYFELLDILKNPKHPEYDERLEWLGENFDPAEFDMETANKTLSQLKW